MVFVFQSIGIVILLASSIGQNAEQHVKRKKVEARELAREDQMFRIEIINSALKRTTTRLSRPLLSVEDESCVEDLGPYPLQDVGDGCERFSGSAFFV